MNAESKILPIDSLPIWRAHLRAAGRRLVATNGCFDLLHAGHVRYLEAARRLGDCLLVGVNSDASVRKIKGPTRPLNPESDRALILGALESVTAVCIFSDPTATRFLEAVQPDVYAKGGDYSLDTLNPDERLTVESGGGSIVIIPLIPGKSTSNLIQQITTKPKKRIP